MRLLINQLKTNFRNILKYKYFFFINILCLVVGILSFLAINNYVVYNTSFDKFHKNSKNIYRVLFHSFKGGQLDQVGAPIPHPIGPLLKSEFSEVVNYMRMRIPGQNLGEFEISCGDKKFSEKQIAFVDTSFFSIFSFKLIAGNPKTALKTLNPVIISESLAKKYFKNEDPLNKVLRIKHSTGNYGWTVVGVIEDMPENSTLNLKIISSWETFKPFEPAVNIVSWGFHAYYTYLLLKDGTDYLQFQNKCQELLAKRSAWILYNKVNTYQYYLQPLKDVHLYSTGIIWDIFVAKGNNVYLIILFLSSVFILLTAYINYMLSQISSVHERSKEIGVRRMLGSSSFKLFQQFFIDSLSVNLLAVVISTILIYLFQPYFNKVLDFSASVYIFSDFFSILIISFIVIFSSIIISMILTLMLTTLKPISNLRKNSNVKKGTLNISTRKVLLIIQLSSTLILMIVTSVIYSQIHFMESQNINCDIDKVVRLNPTVSKDSTMYNGVKSLVYELERLKEVKKVSIDTDSPIGMVSYADVFHSKGDKTNSVTLYDMWICPDYIPVFNIKIIEGRNFSKEMNSDENAAILNEAAVNKLGLQSAKDAVGKYITMYNQDFQIIGVIQNYQNQSFKDNFEPIVFLANWVDNKYSKIKYIHIKLNEPHQAEIMSKISGVFNKIYPEKVVAYCYMPDLAKEVYKDDRKFGLLFKIFTIIAIILSCIGILGVSVYDVNKRAKEIAIRKVNGANMIQIMYIIIAGIIKYVFISIVVGFPIAYYFINDWLEKYAVRISTPWYIFIIVAISAIIISLLATSSVILKAAKQNPLIALRSE